MVLSLRQKTVSLGRWRTILSGLKSRVEQMEQNKRNNIRILSVDGGNELHVAFRPRTFHRQKALAS